jgi:hypothetical protein
VVNVPTARRLVLRDAAGTVIRSVDVSDIDNDSNRAVMTVGVEDQYDGDGWQSREVIMLRPWGRAIKPPTWGKREDPA